MYIYIYILHKGFVSFEVHVINKDNAYIYIYIYIYIYTYNAEEKFYISDIRYHISKTYTFRALVGYYFF